MTEETLVEALSQAEQKLIGIFNAMKVNPELMEILEKKDFARIEKKQAASVANFRSKRI